MTIEIPQSILNKSKKDPTKTILPFKENELWYFYAGDTMGTWHGGLIDKKDIDGKYDQYITWLNGMDDN
jgi:hypothetical protein